MKYTNVKVTDGFDPLLNMSKSNLSVMLVNGEPIKSDVLNQFEIKRGLVIVTEYKNYVEVKFLISTFNILQ